MSETADTEFFQELRVTDRNLETYKKFVHFMPEALPEKAVVLNVGGGEKQIFEKELKEIRPDINVITIDPSIFSDKSWHFSGKDLVSYNRDKMISRIDSLANKSHTVAAYGQRLPLASDSVDAILDIHAASQWATSLESYKTFLEEAMRVLRVGGKLYIGNVYFGDPIIGDEKSEIETLREARSVFDSLGLDADVFLSTEKVLPEYEGKTNVPDKRVCAIVSK